MATKNSCTRYISAGVVIHFPESEGIQCKLCPCLETYARIQCRLTGEYLADGYLVGGYLVGGYLVGGLCPLTLVNEEEENAREYEFTPL